MCSIVRFGFLCFLIAGPAAAQFREISGDVKDQQQAVVVGAQVILTSAQTAATATARARSTLTDGAGHYRFPPVDAGEYVVEVHGKGFRVASRKISVDTGDGGTADFVLALAGTAESVTVTATGGVDRGYRVDAVSSLGPLGSAALLDTPYTISVLPSELMDNAQVRNFKEAAKFLPLVEFQEMQGSEILRPETRGMQGSNMQNTRMDGMGIVVTGANSIETLQQIEVLNGLGGALYGPANPSGMFNFVPKRPTEQPLRDVTVSYDGRSMGTVHADVGGRIGSGRKFGYRANALFGDGETIVNGSNLKRGLVSLAADARPFAHTTIEGFVSYYNLVQHGFPGWFTYGRANARAAFVQLPEDAPDPARQGFGQSSAGLDLTSRIGEVRVKQDINANWRLSVGVLNQRTDRDISTQVNALTNSAGNYTSSLATGFAPQFGVLSDLGYLNGRFKTGSISHELAIGSSGYAFNSYSDVTNPSAASVVLGTASISDPVIFPLPTAGIPLHNNLFLSSVVHQQGVNVADTVTLDRHWSFRLTLGQDWIWTDNYNNASVRTGGYRTNGVSPLESVMYKPAPNTTVYGTYGSSLQQGDLSPGAAANPGQALAPYRTHQAEVGYKLLFRQVSFSTAVFRLDRPFANIDPIDNVFKISGDQINTGVEATLSGRVARRLVLSGGLTVLDTNVTKTGNAATDSKHFVGIPAFKSSLLTEYQLPVGTATFLHVNWQSVGRRPIDDINSTYTPAYNVVDIGARYARTIMTRVTTWRIVVNNVSDAHYWSTLGPGNITGTNVGSYTAHLGSPRTVAASMEVAF
ncbi:MAG: TonB-dependent receptor [Acidobacteriota bacterium]